MSGSVPSSPRPAAGVPSPAPTVPSPAQARAGPEIRVGILLSAPSIAVGGESPLMAGKPDGSHLATIPQGQTWQVTPTGPRLTLHGEAGWVSPPLDAITLWGAAAGIPSG